MSLLHLVSRCLTGLLAPLACSAGDCLYQYSSYNGLLAGLLDGGPAYATLAGQVDTGLGTFHGLDGEMIMLEGHIYRVDAAGTVTEMPWSSTTPYYTLIQFAPEVSWELPAGLDLAALTAELDRRVPNQNNPAAILVTGHFRQITCRSVPGQQAPYPPLVEIVRNQSLFKAEDIEGTLVGFRFPGYLGTLNPPGYHFHFISADRTFGGHLISLQTGAVTAQIDSATQIDLRLPDNSEARAADLSVDRTAAQRAVVTGKVEE